MKYKQRGQTIIELVVMVGVIVVIVMGLVVASTTSLSRSRSTRSRSIATKYAQEGIEIVRNLRNSTTWSSFNTSYVGNPDPRVWCVNDAGSMVAANGAGNCSPAFNVVSEYKRTVSLEYINDDKVLVIATVLWRESQADATSVLQTYLTSWR